MRSALCLLHSPRTQGFCDSLPFLSQESYLSLASPPLISLSAPVHPSNLGSNIISSTKSSLSADPSDMLCHLITYPLTPCFPLKYMSNCEKIVRKYVWKLWCSIHLRGIMERPEEGCGFSLPRALSSVPAEDLTNNVKNWKYYLHTHTNHRCPSRADKCQRNTQKSVKSQSAGCSVMSDSLWPHRLLPARLLRPWDSPGKNTGVGCPALLQGIFLTQELNLGPRHCRQTLYHLSHQGVWILLPEHVTLTPSISHVTFASGNSIKGQIGLLQLPLENATDGVA